MSEEKLRDLQAAILQPLPQASAESHQSFGMGSISRRLRLLYGDNYRFLVESQEGCYTRVTLEIPKERPAAAQDYVRGEVRDEENGADHRG